MSITKISPSVVDFDAGITISTADNTDTLTLTSTDADANSGPNLNLYRNSGSPADNDVLGYLKFTGVNDNSEIINYARIRTDLTDASDGTEDGSFYIFAMNAGTERTRVSVVPSETVFNDESQDIDFRVESNGNANMLFVDGGNDSVLVGHNTDISIAGESHELQVYDTNFSVISGATFRNGSDGANLTLAHSRSGTIGTQTILQDGDTMGGINFMGSDGTDMASYGGRIFCEVDGTPGSNDMPGRLIFATTADGATGSTERLRINAAGHTGFNTSSIQTFTDYTSYHFGPAGTGSTAVLIDDSNGATGRFQILMSGSGYLGMRSNDALIFTTNDSERARIKADGEWVFGAGLMAIGTTSRTGGASSGNVTIEFSGNTQNAIKTRDTTGTTNSNAMVFVNGSTAVGTISTNSSATAYNTSSDYRLKENVNYDWDALTTLKQLKPAKFNFKLDADNTVEGFLAHEVSSLVPAAVKGEKDAMETRTKLILDSKGEVLEEGVEEDAWTAGKEDETYPADSTWEASKEYPSYQQIDQSKLVPLMVKAIQELEAKVKALEEA